jgi:hypothetical protein
MGVGDIEGDLRREAEGALVEGIEMLFEAILDGIKGGAS